MNRLSLYLAILLFGIGVALLVQGTKPPEHYAQQAGLKVVEMRLAPSRAEAARLRVEAAQLIDQAFEWKKLRMDAALALMGGGVVLFGVFLSTRGRKAVARGKVLVASPFALPLAIVSLVAFGGGLFLFSQSISAQPGFAIEAARTFNAIDEAKASYDFARAAQLEREMEHSRARAAAARNLKRWVGLGLLGGSLVGFITHLRLGRPRRSAAVRA